MVQLERGTLLSRNRALVAAAQGSHCVVTSTTGTWHSHPVEVAHGILVAATALALRSVELAKRKTALAPRPSRRDPAA